MEHFLHMAVAAARRALFRNKGKDWASSFGIVRAGYLRAVAVKNHGKEALQMTIQGRERANGEPSRGRHFF